MQGGVDYMEKKVQELLLMLNNLIVSLVFCKSKVDLVLLLVLTGHWRK